MAAGSALKKITTRARHIRRIHGGTWKSAVNKASAEYRAGKLGKVVTMHKRKRAPRRKSRKVSGLQTGVLYKSSGKRLTATAAAMGGRPHNGMIGGGGHGGDSGVMGSVRMGSVKRHLSNAKKILEHNIGILETKKFVAKKKATKRKIQKKITEAKSKFRKLC